MNTTIKIRNAKILSLRGKKSFGLIARELGISRNVVAGVCFRADWPAATRVASSGRSKRNKCGMGYRTGSRAEETLPCGCQARAGAQ
jgi:hypothetical protein